MGTVILHAGIPKAGSSGVQEWLAENAEALRERGIEVAVVRSRTAPGAAHAELHLESYESGGVNSGAFVTVYLGFERDRGVLDRLFEELHEFADRFPTVVVSSEGFAQLFSVDGGDAAFVAKLEELAGAHSVRVAYYARPQHTCLEAAWRQWGFRVGRPPSAYVAEYAEMLHYQPTADAVAAAAPNVSFEIRPFRSDLLLHGSPAADFAECFLEQGDLAVADHDRRVNVGLPLELINALRFGPPELLGRDSFDNRALGRMQSVFRDVQLSEGTRIHRSRRVLQAYCAETFGAENEMLVSEHGWPAGDFVPAVNLPEWDLGELNDLWKPEASAAELALLFGALLAAITEAPAP